MTPTAADAAPALAPRRDPNVLISVVASSVTAFLVLTGADTWRLIQDQPTALLAFLALTVALQIVSVEVYNRGSISFASAGLLAVGIQFGAGPAMAVAALMGIVNLVVRRGRVNRGVFDAAQFSLAAGAGAIVYQLVHSLATTGLASIAAALAAALVYMVVNIGLLSFAMSLAEGRDVVELWKERFRWTTPYYFVSGPLALALTTAYQQLDLTGLLAFTLPPMIVMFSVRQYARKTEQAAEEVRQKNEELRLANAALAERNEDLHALFEFAGGLAARAHDRHALAGYAEDALAALTGGAAEVRVGGEASGGIGLVSGGARVGSLLLEDRPGFDRDRWDRLRDAIVPQLATAIESSDLVEQVRKTHLATIAALSRSMEAKDYYTGGHTERVSSVAVSLARRLGYSGPELDALEVGALLHDIGKIGIPERILHKPAALDADEWKVMKEHPIISEYILSGVDLPDVVVQIARSSHESYDGSGYPDGLAGTDIPLAARIVLVADAFDALTSDRPYRRGRHVRAAMDEIRANTGSQFCPVVVDALERLFREEPHLLGATTLRAVGEVA